MALITCKDCGKEFSTDAKRCPHCGARPPKIKKPMTRNTKILIGIVVALIAIQSVRPKRESAAESGPPRTAIAVSVTVEPKGNSGYPIIYGTTNLPAGTNLIISMTRSGSSYKAQAKSVVASNGHFGSGDPFSDRGSTLAPGEYQVEVLMPSSAGQPPSVKALIGSHGEYLSGPLVQPGPGSLGKVVQFTTTFTLGSK